MASETFSAYMKAHPEIPGHYQGEGDGYYFRRNVPNFFIRFLQAGMPWRNEQLHWLMKGDLLSLDDVQDLVRSIPTARLLEYMVWELEQFPDDLQEFLEGDGEFLLSYMRSWMGEHHGMALALLALRKRARVLANTTRNAAYSHIAERVEDLLESWAQRPGNEIPQELLEEAYEDQD